MRSQPAIARLHQYPRRRSAGGRGAFRRGRVTSSIATIAPSPRTSPTSGKRSRQPRHALGRHARRALRPLDQPLALEDIEHRQRRGARHGIAAVGATEATGQRRVHDLGRDRRPRPAAAHRRATSPAASGQARRRNARWRTSSRCARSRSAPRRRSAGCRGACKSRAASAGNRAGGTTKPPSPCTGSTMIAATCSAATRVRNARSRARAHSWHDPRRPCRCAAGS